MQNFRALGLRPQTPSLQQLGASPPDPHWPPAAGGGALRPPKQPSSLRISGYAPDFNSENHNNYEKVSSLWQFEGFADVIKGCKKYVKSVLGAHHLVSVSSYLLFLSKRNCFSNDFLFSKPSKRVKFYLKYAKTALLSTSHS